MRLLPGWLAGQPGGVWTLDGDASIRRRPVDRIAEPLRLMGAAVEASDGRFPPFTVRGAELTGIEYELPVASAQVKSCVLIAGMHASGATSVIEGTTSRDHTERLLRRARVPFERDGGRITVEAGGRARARRGGGAGRPVVGGLRRGRRDPRERLARGGEGRGPQLDAHRLLPDRRANGRGDRRRARGAGHGVGRGAARRAGRGVGPARGHGRGAGRGAARDRRAHAGRPAGRARGGRDGRARRRGAPPEGVGPDRGRGRGAARPGRRHRGARRTASSSAATARRSGAARSTPGATTAWRCSARWPGSPRSRAWR